MMHEHGKSDRRVVPTKPPNKGDGEPPPGVSSCETGGGGGGKTPGQEQSAPANHVPDAAPGSHVTRPGADTSSSKSRSEDAVHRALSPCLSS